VLLGPSDLQISEGFLVDSLWEEEVGMVWKVIYIWF
jgi:hypothetical protein